jgi:hypothetical protein
MVTAVADAGPVVHRAAPNAWWVALTDAPGVAEEVLKDLDSTSTPSQALCFLEQRVADRPIAAVVAKLELDVCGAWLTVANACTTRPVVVRRAGWVDLRGHPGTALTTAARYEPTDDRVGLGPADILVLHLGPDTAGDGVDDDVVDACLGCAGSPPQDVADAVRARAGGQVVAIGVPLELGTDPLLRVAAATGTPADEVQSPGYPLGDLQPDLWTQPPRPPRLARLRLSAERSGVASVRSLLDRLLASWRLDGRLDPMDVKLVATELAANAVVHTGAPETVTVRYLTDVVRIEVSDGASRDPVPRPAAPDAVDGRGLQLVQALSSAWGTEHFADGKRVWCDLAVAQD